MRYQNRLLLHTYFHQAVNFRILDPGEVCLENEDIAFPMQCQEPSSKLDWVALNMAPVDEDTP
ncbi:hypothetical protein HanPSC8_Chr09g0396491 [Helianthus annuus]|nr:hypothetical protein HanPSC8_Chr09g0396491 [Helianthus annuus]